MARELTKLHEQVVRGSLAELVAAVADGHIPARGEVVIIVGMATPTTDARTPPADALAAARAEVDRLVAAGSPRGDAARTVAASSGIPRRQLYGGAATEADA